MSRSRRVKYWRPWKGYLKHYGKRKHRAREAAAIQTGKYEKLDNRSYKNAADPWDWD